MIRMWMLQPKYLCNMQLTISHAELHNILKFLKRQCDINSLIKPCVHIELKSIITYHDKIAYEMEHRGILHSSPILSYMVCTNYLPNYIRNATVDRRRSKNEIISICSECERNMLNIKLEDLKV